MQVSPVMWWRSWAKKEFASSRSIGRIDSSRERIWRRADGTDEERRRLVIESLGAGRNSKSPRADCLGLRTSLLTPCRTKNRVFTRPKGWKVAKTSRIKVSRGPIVAQPTTKGGGRVPSGASGSPVPPSRLLQIPGRLDWFLYTLNRVYRKLFLDRWTFRMFIIHMRYILSRE